MITGPNSVRFTEEKKGYCNQCGDMMVPLKYCEECNEEMCINCWGDTTNDPDKEPQDWTGEKHCDQCYWDKEDAKT